LIFSGTLKKILPIRGTKEIIYTLVVADGSTGPFYCVTNAKKISASVIPDDNGKVCVMPKTERKGERSMLAYLEWAVARRTLVEGDVLLMDNEGSFKTPWVQDFMESRGITPLYFPPYLGSIMNPCDNSFHSTFKLAFQKLLVTKGTVSTEKRTNLPTRPINPSVTNQLSTCFTMWGYLAKTLAVPWRLCSKKGVCPLQSGRERMQDAMLNIGSGRTLNQLMTVTSFFWRSFYSSYCTCLPCGID
jgi:hypothetical protein